MKAFAVGIDLGGTSCKIGLFNEAGVLQKDWSIPTSKEENGKYILPEIAASLRENLEEQHLLPGDVQSVGLAVPGAVSRAGIVDGCDNLGWERCEPARLLAEELPEVETIRVLNDANAAALGEVWQGAGKEAESLCMVTLGTGVGGALVLQGKLIEGAFGAAGEIGHLPVDPSESRPCKCGKRGCLEQYVAAPALVRMANERLQEEGAASVLCAGENLSARELIDAAKAGDALAKQVLCSAAEYLGRALAMVSCVFDPALFLLGGGISEAGDVLFVPVREAFGRYAYHASKQTRIEKAALGNVAGMIGAAQFARR